MDKCDAVAVIETAQVAVEPKRLEPGCIYAVVGCDGGVVIEDTMGYLDRPAKVVRTVNLSDVGSFIAYIKDAPDPEVFAAGRDVVAILDPQGWRRHRVVLKLRSAPEWEAWMDHSGRLMSQMEFADFVEDQLSTIIAPDGATLLEIAQSMQARTKVDWKSAEWLADGQRSFQYDEQVDAKAGRGGKLEIPAQFTLALRPFIGCDPFEVKANLRYRITNGQLMIGFKLVEPERRLEVAGDEVVARIESETSLPVFRGWSE